MVVIQRIKNVLEQYQAVNLPLMTRRVIAKEVLVGYLLEWIYNHREYRKLKLYGGTCARAVYGLNRMSEDIDLDNSEEVILSTLQDELQEYLRGVLKLPKVEVVRQGKGQIKRWLVKLPILEELGMSSNRAEKLHLKVEVSENKQLSRETMTPYVRDGHSVVIRHWDESSLMAGKILACLARSFVKGDSGIDYKGRDYYDLLWYMERGVELHEEKVLTESTGYLSMKAVWEGLEARVKRIKPDEIASDLENLFEQREFVRVWSENMQELFMRYLRKYHDDGA